MEREDDIVFLTKYAEWQDTVAQYPVEQEGPYLALGLTDECGEVTVAVAGGAESNMEATLKECGDALWYASRYVVRILGLPLAHFIGQIDFHKPYVPINISTGIICAVEKKRLRDGANWTPAIEADKAAQALLAMEDVIRWIHRTVNATGHDLRAAYELNQFKLSKRLEEGKIKGDGDNR